MTNQIKFSLDGKEVSAFMLAAEIGNGKMLKQFKDRNIELTVADAENITEVEGIKDLVKYAAKMEQKRESIGVFRNKLKVLCRYK